MQNAAIKRHKLTVDGYHSMDHAGILSAEDRVDLIEGELIDLQSRHLEWRRDPRPEGTYADVEILKEGAITRPALLPEVAVEVAEVLG